MSGIEIEGRASWKFAVTIPGITSEEYEDLSQWEQDEMIAEALTQRDGGIERTLTPGTEEFDIDEIEDLS